MNNNIFFISDSHLNHKAILTYTNRPFVNVEDMNNEIIRNWNDVVPSNGVVYHLGDVAFGNSTEALEILNRLNGTIHLISGNHEKTVLQNKKLRDRFEKIYDICFLKVEDDELNNVGSKGKQLIVLCHYPFQSWKNSCHGSWHLHGHSHNTLPTPDDMLRLDVGVDNPLCDFGVISYQKVKEHMLSKNYKPITRNDG